MGKRLKIAVFSGTIPSTTFIEHLIKGVSQTHKVLLFGVQTKPVAYESEHIKVYDTPKSHVKNAVVSSYRLLQLVLKSPKDAVKLYRHTSQFKKRYERWVWFTKVLPIILHKPDVFHIQWAKDVAFYTVLQDAFGIPIVVSLRGAHINYTPIVDLSTAIIYKQEFPKIKAFHAVSKAIGEEVKLYGAKAPSIHTIHSPIPPFFFDHYRACETVQDKTIRLVSVGRFHWVKGYETALDAVALLKNKGYNIHYTIVGPDEFTEALLFQCHQLNLVDNVALVGAMPQTELISFLRQFHGMLLPSLKEGIANVVLEAMAVGLPVVSTDCGGMAEVVIPNETGWLVPVRDSEAMADAVIALSETSELELHAITKRAHELVKREFNAEDSIAQFVRLYEGVVGG
ncbi:glycosyltransferase family 4 protein [Winogradskyella thalassocola]|uniref:Colanic acid/amylovoran biosynthesis glycosyltransferase n=1 Tax=Winogradskyella thalassocola TaxID=262004 RepID=A0A1G8FZ11_9FLAO|nr:glycosyltransferase family 4 protein [Winogradskyella thalassocola]SDH87361.1 colanic acid/amylovoran biosynthesis glycosyltransferase [Winogradskyella thalassocola]